MTNEPILSAKEERFGFLLSSLLLLFLLYPLLEGSILGAAILDLFVSVALLLTVRALRGPRRNTLVAALCLCVPAIAAAAGTHVFHFMPLMPVGHIFGLLFFLLTGTTILKRVLEPGPIDANRLQAAVSAYLLLGFGWALVYSTIEHLAPGSFQDDLARGGHEHAVLAGFPHLIYYSFATLTTLGYGDVIPTSTLARSFSTLEAVIGQLYLALLVARLVGLHIARLAVNQLTECPAERDSAQTEAEPPASG